MRQGDTVPLQDYLTTLKSHWVLILICALLGGGIAYTYSQFVVPQYRSQADVLVLPARGDNPAELAQGANYVNSLAQTYTLLAVSPEVLEPVIEELDLEMTPNQLARTIDVEVPMDTYVIQIGVTSPDKAQAQSVADAIADQLGHTVPDVSPEGENGSPSVQVTTIAAASDPAHPIYPNTKKLGLIGIAVGIAIGAAVAIFRRHFGSRLDTAADVTALTDVGVLGEIPDAGGRRGLVRAVRNSPQGRSAEALRQLAASLRFINLGGDRRVLMVTSGSAEEGKTSISLGLALTIAEAGSSVLYLEADLRRPSAATHTGLETSVGVTDVLVGDTTISDAAQQWGHPGLSVLARGAEPPNPGQILASDELGNLISSARDQFDFVVVDSPPVLVVSDALWLSASVDGTLLVARAGRTRIADFQRTLEAMERAEHPVIGIVLDGVKAGSRSPYVVEDSTAPATP